MDNFGDESTQKTDQDGLPTSINILSLLSRDAKQTVSVLGHSQQTASFDTAEFPKVVFDYPPHPPFVPNKDLQLNKEKIHRTLKELM